MGYKKMKGVNAFKKNFPHAFKNEDTKLVGDEVKTESDVLGPSIKHNTKEGKKYQRDTIGNKFIFRGEYYDTKEEWRAAIAKSKGMSSEEYRASRNKKK